MIPGVRVLFVCTANVSRSPYAQIRTTALFGPLLSASSAGVPGTDGLTMDPAMRAVLPSGDDAALMHRSRSLTRTILALNDLVLTMEFGQHMRIVEQWPEMGRKVFGLRQFVDGIVRAAPKGSVRTRIREARAAAGPNSVMWDIADPYRRGRRAARACAADLDDLVLALGVGLGYEAIAED